MKAIIILFWIACLNLAFPAFAVLDDEAGIISGMGGAACTASYGTELATSANAIDDSGGSETDATTNWTNSGMSVFDSVTTSPSAGTYHFTATADGSGDAIGIQYGTVYSINNEDFIKITFDIKSDGTNSFSYGLSRAGNITLSNYALNYGTITSNTYSSITWYTSLREGGGNADNDYLTILEGSDAGTVDIDNLSIKIATLCYDTAIYNNGADNPVSETDSLGSWTSGAVGTMEFASVDTNDSTCGGGDCADPYDGTYHIWFNANNNNGAFAYIDLTSHGLTNGEKYRIDIRVKSSGNDAIAFILNDGANVTSPVISFFQANATDTGYILYSYVLPFNSTSHRYLVMYENGTNNNASGYVDSFVVRRITGE